MFEEARAEALVGILEGEGDAGGCSRGDLTLGENPTRFLGEGV